MSDRRRFNNWVPLGLVFLAGCTPTGATLEEGPWTLKINGAEIGKAFATKPSGSVWGEYFERRDAGWGWPASGVTWEVYARASTYTSGEQPSCTDDATYQACQRTSVTRTATGSMSPKEWFTPDDDTLADAVRVNEYHTPGKLSITASYTNNNGGAVVTKVADYFVSVDSTDANKRKELICAPSGFLWPSKANPSRTEVYWTIAWVDGSTATACPSGTTKHKYTVDLDP